MVLEEVIQTTPQMKILVAIEAVDGRKGIDALARLCEEKPLDRTVFPDGCSLFHLNREGV